MDPRDPIHVGPAAGRRALPPPPEGDPTVDYTVGDVLGPRVRPLDAFWDLRADATGPPAASPPADGTVFSGFWSLPIQLAITSVARALYRNGFERPDWSLGIVAGGARPHARRHARFAIPRRRDGRIVPPPRRRRFSSVRGRAGPRSASRPSNRPGL